MTQDFREEIAREMETTAHKLLAPYLLAILVMVCSTMFTLRTSAGFVGWLMSTVALIVTLILAHWRESLQRKAARIRSSMGKRA
jgi:hypothetical protein